MCGIAGVVGVEDASKAQAAVQRMMDSMARRGPDSEGFDSWPAAVLGHRRLSIFDLSSAGSQPMVSKDRSVGLVFNGAIYNFVELRSELMARGCQFHSETDTEVLLHGYMEWGIDRLVPKLRGMFAFGLWDDSKRRLYLVRDRLGVKPLVFSIRNGSIAFASTARALRSCEWIEDLDPMGVLEFLEHGFLADHRSIYREVSKVPAGTIVQWEEGALSKRQYWSMPEPDGKQTGSFDEVVARVENILLESVKLRLRADVPVGALLSGGIDSGLVCWAVARLGGDVTAYTVAIPRDPTDEASDAEKTARALGIKHRLINFSEKIQPDMQELVSAYSEPFASPSALGMLALSKIISPSAKVLLTGDGGDDVFLGYPRHRHLMIAGALTHIIPDKIKHFWLSSRKLVPRTGPLGRAASMLDYISGDLSAFGAGGKLDGLLGERLLESLDGDRRKAVPAIEKGLSAFLEFERQDRFVGEYMTKVDGAAMYYSLEARSPFLDHQLWEYAASLPCGIRLHHGRLKAVLRELAKRHIGPTLARRRKTGFEIPVRRWLAGEWRSCVQSLFRDSILDKNGWIRSQSVLDRLNSTPNGGTASDELWNVFVLESWLRHEQLPTN
jgi:asparagine synthase (glutamine-hydrolysing)